MSGFYTGFLLGGEIRFYVFLNMYSLLCFPLVLLLSFIWQWFSKGASALGTECAFNPH